MNIGTNYIATDADVEQAWVAALSDEHMNDLMQTTPSKNECVDYGSDGNIIMKIAGSEIKGLFAEDV